jgi:hypothetical protein
MDDPKHNYSSNNVSCERVVARECPLPASMTNSGVYRAHVSCEGVVARECLLYMTYWTRTLLLPSVVDSELVRSQIMWL